MTISIGQFTKQPLGKLERQSLSDVWPNEAQYFTPWLAQNENIALLASTLGLLDLQVQNTEVGVGPYRADIVCKDADEALVLIENQVVQTDHRHLGQLLTYAAGLEAATIIWIAEDFSDQHRAALDWLNEITGEKFNFFGVEIQLWRIGSSAIAPMFNVVSQPNGWAKAVREQGTGQESSTAQANLEFWSILSKMLDDRKSVVRLRTPAAKYWRHFSLGHPGALLVGINSMEHDFSRIYLRLMGQQKNAYFHLLHDNYKDQIESKIAQPVKWRELPNNNQSQIVVERASKPSDPSTWPELSAWFADTLETMATTFKQLLPTIDVTAYQGAHPSADTFDAASDNDGDDH